MTVIVYERWHEALRELRAPWSSLVAAQRYNPSLHPDWLEATLSSHGLLDETRVALVRTPGGSETIVPFLIRRRTLLGVPLRCLELASNVISYHAEIVSSGEVTGALREFLADRAVRGWDALRATALPENGPTASALRALDSGLVTGLTATPGQRSPYVPVDRDWNAYLASRSQSTRRVLVRSRRMMQEAGESGMTWYEGDCDTGQLLDTMLAIEADSWKVKAGVAIVSGTPQHAYYQRLLPWLARNAALVANVLYVHGAPAAYTLCAAWCGWTGQLKTSFVDQYRNAGSRVVHSSLERSFSSGAREYDFLGDAEPHKTRWADLIRPHEELWVFARHLRGRAFARLKALSDRRRSRRPAPEGAARDQEP